MKHLTFLFLMVITSSMYAQEIETLTFQQANDIKYFSEVKNGTGVKNYIASDGSKIGLKDTLVIGKPTMITKKSLEYIIYGKPGGVGNLFAMVGGNLPTPIDFRYTGQKVLVEDISLYHNGSKKKPLKIMIRLGDINGRAFVNFKYLTVMDYDLAFNSGEIRPLNQQMTREEAIAKLKEGKDLLDLGLMSKEEFDKLRAELSKIILKQQ